jgi:two-component sensor histidine kinase
LRRLVTIDLPRRLSRRLPRALTELLVGLGITSLFVLLRAAVAPLPDELAPFALSFLAIVLATLIGGWRSGLVALVAGQLLIWYFLLPPYRSFGIADAAMGFGLLLSTGTQAVILFALALYQREVRAGQVERARRINFLGHALREMDHRTKNNFQIVTSLLSLQGARSTNPEVQSALREAAERLKAVAAVYDALAPSSQGLATVRLQDQLEEICSQIRRGILPDAIRLETELEPILVPNETAVAIGIIVNELVTNACKHAFGDGGGVIRVRAVRDGAAARIEVADDGRGMPPARQGKGGLGTRLVAAFAQRLGGTSEVRSSAAGTVHSIVVPLRS